MTFNLPMLIPAGFNVTERAAMLGHSVKTNLKHYSFDPRDSEREKIDRINVFLQREMGRTRSGGPRLCADRAGGETLNHGFKEPSAWYKKSRYIRICFSYTMREMGLEPTRSQ